jgi:hypothetical protein
MKNTVKIIKFVSNQEIIAKVVTASKTEIIVDAPLSVQPMRTGDQSLSIGLMPFTWAGSNKESISLNRAHVLCVMSPEEDLQTQYLAALSGITLASTTPKITLT